MKFRQSVKGQGKIDAKSKIQYAAGGSVRG